MDYVQTIVRSLNYYSTTKREKGRGYNVKRLVTHLVYLDGGGVEVDTLELEVCLHR